MENTRYLRFKTREIGDCVDSVMKPVIKTFVYKGKYYCYDTYYNRLLSVSKQHFVEINKLKNYGIEKYKSLDCKSVAYRDILKLINKGYFRENIVERVKHPESDRLETLLNQCINDVVFQVTQQCNFSCRYCLYANDTHVERNHANREMSWKIAKETVDFIYKHSSDSQSISMSFYGGEPLLNFSLICNIVNYANSLFFSKKVNYSMTVNGSLLTNEIVDFLIKHNFNISVSLDGPKKLQNKHRRFLSSGEGTYDSVVRNLRRIKKNNILYFEQNVDFLPVIMDDEDYREVVNFFESNGIDMSKVSPLKANLSGIDYFLSNNGINNSDLYSSDESNALINQGNEKHLFEIYNQKSYIPKVWHHGGQCVLGVRRLFVDVNGLFFPCEKITEDKTMSIGNINEGFNTEKILEYLNVGDLSADRCKSCWAMRFCEVCVALCNDLDEKKISKKRKMYACDAQERKAMWFFRKLIDKEGN